MPVFPWSARGGVPPLGDPALDALLTGNVLPEDAPEELRPVAESLAALNAAPHSSELAGEAKARALFRAAAAQPAEPAHSHRRKRRPLPSLRSVRLAAAIAAGLVVLGGTALGAYAGILPVPVQRSAHQTGGASPAPHSAPPAPAVPQATGTAHLPKAKAGRRVNAKGARGLCNAYAHQKAHGKQNSAVFRKLAAAAGGAAKIPAFCASVRQPGASVPTQPSPQPATSAGPPSSRPGQPGAHPTGKPSSHPTGKPSSHPTGKPSSHPTGKPSHPTGQPTSILV
jgi:hypothetical protein